ncbi:MAG TPA: VWA domain-containing protein [Pirellulales bacterium]|jgi:hypothetical protein|nr:VWA domain-containing protein [Pirellulales bacterium]
MFSLSRFGLPATHIRRTIASLAASSGMHALLLATLAVVVVKAHHAVPAERPQASLALPATSGALDSAGIDASLANATAPQHAARAATAGNTAQAPSLPYPFPSALHVAIDPAALLPAEPSSLDRKELLSADAMVADPRAPQNQQPMAAGAGVGAAGAGQGGTGHSFFGLEAAGDKVVFVVDISGSMSGRRFFRARNELRQSIENLRENQQFFVIFFNDGALPMPTEKLLPATRDNVNQTVDWLKYVECGGGTNPLPGLLLALQLHPDAIYLLTDGKFDPQVVWEVTQAEPPIPIPIYTISFANRTAEKLLKAIAKETGGSYRFVR